GAVVKSQEVASIQQSVGSSQEVASSQYAVVRSQEPSANGQEIDAVMPALRPSSGQAPAGIPESHAEASSESPWIPASTGMTPLPSFPQNDVDGGQESTFSPLSPHP